MTFLPCRALALLAVLTGPLAFGAPLTPVQKALLAKGNRHEKAGWIYLHVEGSPRARGFQHGYLLAPELDRSLKATRATWVHTTAMTWAWLLAKAETQFTPRVDPEDAAELDGIVEGLAAAGVSSSRTELVVHNGMSEYLDYWWPQELSRIRGFPVHIPVKEACSSFIATGSYTKDGGIVLAHNTMTGYQDPQANVVLDLVPDQGHRILMQTVPGYIHSATDFFLTDAGLVGSETTIGSFDAYEPGGIPEFVRMRRATQDAGTLDQWCAVLRQGNNGGYANAWLLGDTRTGEIVRLELGLRHVGFERTKDGYFIGSNVAENLQILRLETTAKETDINQSSVARRVRWKQLMAEYKGRIDVETAKAFETDHHDMAQGGKDHPGSRSLCAHCDLDAEAVLWDVPFAPAGTVDAKVVDTRMARRMAFAARYGSGCGLPFDAHAFLEAHPQFEWITDFLPSRPAQPWVEFTAGEGSR